jgi:hypothetical protein
MRTRSYTIAAILIAIALYLGYYLGSSTIPIPKPLPDYTLTVTNIGGQDVVVVSGVMGYTKFKAKNDSKYLDSVDLRYQNGLDTAKSYDFSAGPWVTFAPDGGLVFLMRYNSPDGWKHYGNRKTTAKRMREMFEIFNPGSSPTGTIKVTMGN